MPVPAVDHRNRAAGDLEARVPARGVGHSNATLRDLVFGRRQQNAEATIIRHSRHTDRNAPRSCPQLVGASRSIGPVLTKYGQTAHSALPFRARSARPAIPEKWVRGIVVPHVARAQVAKGAGGITNAPSGTNRLRV